MGCLPKGRPESELLVEMLSRDPSTTDGTNKIAEAKEKKNENNNNMGPNNVVYVVAAIFIDL